ncbi:MAG TPA: lipopolysaccharide assembly protein LapA domain-containing protein, partial [Dermatophilaceae bacterium]
AGASPEPPRPDVPPKSQGTATLAPSAVATTRAAAAWFATAVALVLLLLLIILILQNQDVVTLHYLGFTGSLPLGTALFIAAVAGGAVVAIVGVVRLTQLPATARRARRLQAERENKP